jgi:hypothetical protein
MDETLGGGVTSAIGDESLISNEIKLSARALSRKSKCPKPANGEPEMIQ